MCVGGNDSVSLSNCIDLSQESEQSCICVLEVMILSRYYFSIELLNCQVVVNFLTFV